VDILLVSGSLSSDENLYELRKAVRHARQVIAVGTCAIAWSSMLSTRAERRQQFQADRLHLPHQLRRARPVDSQVAVDRYLPGGPPTPELFIAALSEPSDFKVPSSVCQECGRKKVKEMRPSHLVGFQKGQVLPEICLINQGYLCIGVSTRGGCRALCTRAGHPCVGCRGPSDAFIEKESQAWFTSIQRVFTTMTDIPVEEIIATLHSPQLGMFLYQFADYAESEREHLDARIAAASAPEKSPPPRSKEKVM